MVDLLSVALAYPCREVALPLGQLDYADAAAQVVVYGVVARIAAVDEGYAVVGYDVVIVVVVADECRDDVAALLHGGEHSSIYGRGALRFAPDAANGLGISCARLGILGQWNMEKGIRRQRLSSVGERILAAGAAVMFDLLEPYFLSPSIVE